MVMAVDDVQAIFSMSLVRDAGSTLRKTSSFCTTLKMSPSSPKKAICRAMVTFILSTASLLVQGFLAVWPRVLSSRAGDRSQASSPMIPPPRAFSNVLRRSLDPIRANPCRLALGSLVPDTFSGLLRRPELRAESRPGDPALGDPEPFLLRGDWPPPCSMASSDSKPGITASFIFSYPGIGTPSHRRSARPSRTLQVVLMRLAMASTLVMVAWLSSTSLSTCLCALLNSCLIFHTSKV
mmetsp:Transcript_37403/g.95570  ORF Transcript_37403/g.95570 Transcript_37403/m.95570 type:complete len:238 (-) Transcript_37403:1333-2046(-)